MDPELYRRTKTIVDQALDRPLAEQRAFVTEACGDDAALLDEVRSLLSAASVDEGFLEEPLLERLDDPATELGKVGPYFLEETLGEGGMGIVFRAVRKEPFEQQVALKLIQPGMSSGAIVARFAHERQILAQLEHPNIARLLDGGTTDAGRPYFVMEYVSGQKIDDFCRQRGLDLSARLDLFTKVCEAVLFAHRRLVVHRDLKPANILVTRDGEPKLLDFGIAKLLGEDAGQATRLLGIGTPRYSSPEQLAGQGLTTASDVYSLGVVFYEVLTGERHDVGITKSLPGRLEALLRLQPKPPSQQAKDPEARRRLEGDLDAIVLKMLRPEVESRYPSVDELLDDLARYRQGFPVRARKGRWSYRLVKMVRRNRVRIAALATALVLAAVSLWGSLESERREQQENFAQELNEYVFDIFRAASPREAGRVDPELQELLESGVNRLEGKFEQNPEIVAAFLSAIGQAYRHYGDYDRAEELLRESLSRRRTMLGPKHPDLANSCINLALALREKFELEEALELAEESLAIHQANEGPEGRSMIQAYAAVAGLNRALGRSDAAVRFYQRSLEVREDHFPDSSVGLARGLNNLGRALSDAQRFDEAERAYTRGLDLVQERLQKIDLDGPAYEGEDSQLEGVRTTLLFSQGDFLLEQGDPTGAAWRLRESLEARRRGLPETHRRIAEVELVVGRLETELGNFETAALHLETAHANFLHSLGDDHPQVAYALRDRAKLALAQGERSQARALAEEALGILEARLDPGHPRRVKVEALVASLAGDAEPASEDAMVVEGAR